MSIFFRDRPHFTRGFRKHLSKSIPYQALPRTLSKIQACFKGFSQECTSLYILEHEFLQEQKLAAAWNHARPWAF